MAPKGKESQEQPVSRPQDSPHPALKLRHTLRGHTASVYRMALSPDGRILASPSDDKTVRLWDVENGQRLRMLEHQDRVICVAWSPDGTRLATGTNDGYKVYLWDATTGRQIRILGEHGRMVTGVAWSPDGKMLASCSDDQTIRLWDAGKGRALRERAHRISRRCCLVARRQTALFRLVGQHRPAVGCGGRRGDPDAYRAHRDAQLCGLVA